MQKGIVKWFNNERGYGFIESNGKDYFVHYKDINKEGFKCLDEQDKVTFESATSPKGLVARNVTVDS